MRRTFFSTAAASAAMLCLAPQPQAEEMTRWRLALSDSQGERSPGTETPNAEGDESAIVKALKPGADVVVARPSKITAPLTVPTGSWLSVEGAGNLAYSRAGTLRLADRAGYRDRSSSGDSVVFARSFSTQERRSLARDPLGLSQFGIPGYVFATLADASNNGSEFVTNMQSVHKFGGASTQGGRISVLGVLDQTGASAAANPNRNYVGVSGVAISRLGDGGGDLTGSAKGAYFGLHGYCQNPGGTNLAGCVGAELNTAMGAGSSARYVIGLTVAGSNAVQGRIIDAAIDIGGLHAQAGGGEHVGWRQGLNFNDIHGRDPTNARSTLIGSTWIVQPEVPRPIAVGLDARGFAAGRSVILAKANGGGNFLEWQARDGQHALFAVDQGGHVTATGIQTRAGLTGAATGNYFNFSWTGSKLIAYVDDKPVGSVEMQVTVPQAKSSACRTGNFAADENYYYYCVKENTWKRAALSNW